MAQIQSGVSAADVLTVDPISKAARSSLYDPTGNLAVLADQAQPATPAGVMAMGVNDRTVLGMRLDRMGGQASALHNVLLHDSFEGTGNHSLRWLITSTTMAAAQTTVGGFVFNSGNITTVSTGYMLQSTFRMPKTQRTPLQAKIRARLNHVNNSVMELGFGDASTTAGAHTAGAYWQVTSSGALQPVVTYNGVDQTGADVRPLVNNASYYTFDVLMDDDEAIFVLQDTSTGLILSRQSIKLPLSGQRLLSATALPVMARIYNTASAPASAPQMILSDVYVLDLDANKQRPWPHAMAAMGRSALENPFSGVQLSTWANSAAPANATLSNTAAGYTTLGGLFSFAAVAGAETDYALFGFQVPAGSNLRVTAIDIETWNSGAAVATTPHLLAWGVAANQGAVGLTATPTTRIGLGVQSLPVGAAIGAKADRISKSFQTPLITNSGRFIDIVLRMPVASATASQVIRGMVNVEGYFE